MSICAHICTVPCGLLLFFRWPVVLSLENITTLDKTDLGKKWQMPCHFFLPMNRWKNQSWGSKTDSLRSHMVSHPQCQTASISRSSVSATTHCLLTKQMGIHCPLDSRTKALICILLNLHLHTEFIVLNFKWVNQTISPDYYSCSQIQNYVF